MWMEPFFHTWELLGWELLCVIELGMVDMSKKMVWNFDPFWRSFYVLRKGLLVWVKEGFTVNMVESDSSNGSHC